MLPTRDELLAKAKTSPSPPVAIEAYWDGDTTGWMVILSLVCVERSQSDKRYYDYQLGVLRGGGGDFRLFRGNVPPWPEAALASEVGQELSKHFGVPFYFPSPHYPEDECPHWWERELGHPCRDCGVLLLQSDACPSRGLCYHCHLASFRSQIEPSNNPPSSESKSTDTMPVGLRVVLVYMLLTGIGAVFGAAMYPSHFVFYFGYSIACFVAIVGSLRRSKSARYLLIVLLSLYLVIYANTLSSALMSSSTDASDRLIARKIIQIIPLTVALYYLFANGARAYFNDLGLSSGSIAREPTEADLGRDSAANVLTETAREFDDQILHWFGNTSHDVVRVGTGLACIVRITAKQLEYEDESGQERSVDLEECASNWCRYKHENSGDFISLDPNESSVKAARWDAGCVGERDICANPPWVALMNERCTRFEFKNFEEAYALLLGPLQQAGWHTFDSG